MCRMRPASSVRRRLGGSDLPRADRALTVSPRLRLLRMINPRLTRAAAEKAGARMCVCPAPVVYRNRAPARALHANTPGAGASGMPVTAAVGVVTFRADVFPRTTVAFADGVLATPNV